MTPPPFGTFPKIHPIWKCWASLMLHRHLCFHSLEHWWATSGEQPLVFHQLPERLCPIWIRCLFAPPKFHSFQYPAVTSKPNPYLFLSLVNILYSYLWLHLCFWLPCCISWQRSMGHLRPAPLTHRTNKATEPGWNAQLWIWCNEIQTSNTMLLQALTSWWNLSEILIYGFAFDSTHSFCCWIFVNNVSLFGPWRLCLEQTLMFIIHNRGWWEAGIMSQTWEGIKFVTELWR